MAELVERAKSLRYSALAITDECSLSGVVRAHVAAREVGLHLIIGSEMRLTLQGDAKAMEKRIAGAAEAASPQPHTRRVLFVQTRRGYGNHLHWITASRRRGI